MGSKIEWLARPGTKPESWNPWVGCSHFSPGCAHCYAERMAARLKAMGVGAYQNVTDRDGWTGHVEWAEFAQPHLYKPRRWRAPRTIFVCSMSDPFHGGVLSIWLDRVWQTIHDCPQHTFIVVTKRAHRMHGYITRNQQDAPQNLWLVVTAEDQQRAEERIPLLLATPAAVRGVSVEPMLERIDLDLQHAFPAGTCGGDPMALAMLHRAVDQKAAEVACGIDWVICGGESGPGARPMDPDWARGLLDQCQEAGVPFFFKQWGEWAPQPCDAMTGVKPGLNPWGRDGEPVVRVGRKRAGHLLDGREWREWPEAAEHGR